MTRFRRAPGIVVFLGIVCAGCASLRAPAGPAPDSEALSFAQAPPVEIAAAVESVSVAQRRITVQRTRGGSLTMAVDEGVKNLRALGRGSRVKMRYIPAAVIGVRKPGEQIAGAPSPPPGSHTVTTKVLAVERAQRTVTFTGVDGRPMTLEVVRPVHLDRLVEGALAEITYTDAVALAVTKVRR